MLDMLRLILSQIRHTRRVDCQVYFIWDNESKRLIPLK